MKAQIQTRIGLAMGLTLALVLLGGLAPRAEAADVTLGANARISNSGGGQLINTSGGGVLLTATSGAGTQANPYVFDIDGNLNMGSYTILGNTANNSAQYSATWRVTGSVTGSGNFDSYTTVNGTSGGNVRIEAGGSIALNRVKASATYQGDAGSVYLWAMGTVSVATYIDTRAGALGLTRGVTIRSEGPIAGQGITISGSAAGVAGTYSILTEAYMGSFEGTVGGAVSLYCQTNITLAAGITTRGGSGTAGAVIIRGDLTDAGLRAGTVTISGTDGIRTDGTLRSDGNPGGGNVTVRATSLQITGGINTTANCYYSRTGNVNIDVLENATIGGYIDTRLGGLKEGSPGFVKIVARRTRVEGVDGAGYSIRTWSGGTGNTRNSAAGDADVTLTNVNTSAERYKLDSPTNSMTSSIYVAGKINTGRWYDNNAMGNIRISAVEVQLGGDVTNSSSTASSIMDIRYGTNTWINTHLVEGTPGVRWDGVSGHNIGYYPASGTLTIVGDVPYKGLWAPAGMVLMVQ